MIVRQMSVGPMLNWSYLIVCEKTKEAAVVDAAWSPEALSKTLRAEKVNVRWLLCTHGHFDHINAVAPLLAAFPDATAVIHPLEKPDMPSNRLKLVREGDVVRLGEIDIRVMHTPGHTPGSVTYIAEDHAFFGDTLFCGSGCGRVDLYPEGPAEMFATLSRIRDLPDHLVVCSGHKYGRPNTTTMKVEKQKNSALHAESVEELFGL